MASELSPVPNDLEFGATIRRLEVTQQVFDRYKLLRILGRGGMGVVWLAHDERLDREVALKFLPDEIGLDPEAEDEMKRETRRCLDLTHPNIVRIYDFVKDRQAAAISMEYIDGKTFSAYKLDKPKRIFDVEELRPWIAQACQALAYAHEEVGVVHRDLKPANFMLTSRGQLKIADFGIAQSVSDSMGRMTMRRGTSGTLAYMSPQQMNGEVSRVTDDVYAVGATLYELLTSKPPFHSGNVSFQLRVMIPPSIRERRDELEIRGPEVPAEWEDAIAACLRKSAEERPATMIELAERLGLLKARSRSSVSKGRHRSFSWQQVRRTLGQVASRSSSLLLKLGTKSFNWRPAAIAGCSTVMAILFAWSLWHFLLWPAVAPRAQLVIATDPPGATIHLTGHPDVVAPTTLSNLRMGITNCPSPTTDSIRSPKASR